MIAEGGEGGAVVVVVIGCLLDLVLDGGEVVASGEDDGGGVSIADGEVAKELIDGIEIALGSFPEFVFGDEQVLVVVTEVDVGFTVVVKGLAGGEAAVVRVDDIEEEVA